MQYSHSPFRYLFGYYDFHAIVSIIRCHALCEILRINNIKHHLPHSYNSLHSEHAQSLEHLVIKYILYMILLTRYFELPIYILAYFKAFRFDYLMFQAIYNHFQNYLNILQLIIKLIITSLYFTNNNSISDSIYFLPPRGRSSIDIAPF